MSSTPDNEPVLIGRVAKAHGIKGELAIDVMSDLPERFAPKARVQIRGVWHTIVTARPHQGRMLLTFADISDRTTAELLRGQSVYGDAVDVDPGEYYLVNELIHCPVVDQDGNDLGTVVDLVGLPTAAPYDLLEVARADGSTWLLPAVDDYVQVEDDGNVRILRLVNPPEGLIELKDN
jgi:16S rRNA processing protein RimM